MAAALHHLTLSLMSEYPFRMLTYLGGGERRYGENPIRIYGRPYWEFQAVHRGAIAPTFPAGLGVRDRSVKPPRLIALEKTLWVFPPGLEHGWTGRRGEPADISVFHFDGLTESAAAFIRKQGYLEVPMTVEALNRIHALGAELSDLRNGKDPLAGLKFESAGLELAILALSALGPSRTAPLLDRAELVASGAAAWYSEHMAERPSVEDVARSMNCSPSHFRRLYFRARGIAPTEGFESLRLCRAKELLAHGDASIKEIAALCGYDSQSCFSRAFKRAWGLAPRNFQGNDGRP